MIERICFLDFETFWSQEHTLSKMNPIAYVMHPETEIQSVSIAFDDWPIDTLFGEDRIRAAFAKIDWSNTMVVAHNNIGFDALIAAWRFGIRPAAWGCTLAMAKPFYALTVGGSLKKVSEEMGIAAKYGGKGSLDAVGTKGKKLKDFTPDEIEKMKVYNPHDTFLCREIFKTLAPKLGMHEMKQIDMAIRMTVDLEFEADIPLLEQALATELNRKQQALLKLANMVGVVAPSNEPEALAKAMKDVVMSQQKFAALLEQIGVPVPMKESDTATNADGTPKMIPALAKADKGLTDLLEYEDGDYDKQELVRIAAGTRLEVKSTQLESRLKTYLTVANCLGGKLPMPLNYCGAAISWRYSGNMKMNVQNMPRIDPSKPKPTDALRYSVCAPEGKVVVVVDSSNIELRVAHALAGQHDTVDKLKNKEDLYCWFATSLFGRPIGKADKQERFIGKQAMLSLQYGSSWRAFQNMVRVKSAEFGMPMTLSDEESQRIVKVWRAMFPALAGSKQSKGIWQKCDDAIVAMFAGEHMVLDEYGLIQTTHQRLITPNRHWLQYPDLRMHTNSRGKDEWVYGQGQNKSRLYGAHLYENICQHLARLIVMEQTLKLHTRGYPVKLSCHDEAVLVVPDEQGDAVKDLAIEVFSTPPKWWPDLPLAAEADVAYTYGEAK